jgi:hypothetical protein
MYANDSIAKKIKIKKGGKLAEGDISVSKDISSR